MRKRETWVFQCDLSRDENGGIASYIGTTHPRTTSGSYRYVEDVVGSVGVSGSEAEKVWGELERVGGSWRRWSE